MSQMNMFKGMHKDLFTTFGFPSTLNNFLLSFVSMRKSLKSFNSTCEKWETKKKLVFMFVSSVQTQLKIKADVASCLLDV